MKWLLKDEVFFTPQSYELEYEGSKLGVSLRKAFFSEEDMTKREMTEEDEKYNEFIMNSEFWIKNENYLFYEKVTLEPIINDPLFFNDLFN